MRRRAWVIPLCLLPTLTALVAAPARRGGDWASPAGAVQAAAEDVAKLPPALRPYTRYLYLCSLPEGQRATAAAVLSGHCNALSTEADIVPLVAVDAGKRLLRVNLQDYGWSQSLWEQLADVDPYFHADLEEQTSQTKRTITGSRTERRKRQWKRENEIEYVKINGEWRPGYRWDGAKWVQQYNDYEEVEVEHAADIVTAEPTGRKVRALAPWLATTPQERVGLKQLVEMTGSKAPVVDGAWFFAQTAAQQRGKPGYYDFLGIKARKDFEKITGFDKDVLKAAKRKELLEAVALSGVAQQPRRIGVFNAASDLHVWFTFDNELATGQKNPLRVLDDDFKHDAEEAFGGLPNNWWLWGLFKADGTTQNTAPDFIGFDKTSPSSNGRIMVGISCIRCHYTKGLGGEAGIQGLDQKANWARDLFTNPVALQSPDYATLKDLRQKYLRDLQAPIVTDRQVHARAVLAATGMTPDKWSQGAAKLWAGYDDAVVDAEFAARYVGMPKAELIERLKTYTQATGTQDLVVGGLMAGKSVPVRQFEESYPLIQSSVHKIAEKR